MICREVKLLFHWPRWLLVSQVEHARLSAELARHWTAASATGVLRDTNGDDALAREVLAAIEHHDDGWDRWERSPQIDPELGRPLSYRGEVPLNQALVIWSDSIASARTHGPLAGVMVARHFLYLMKGSDSRSDAAARSWRKAMEANCVNWLAEWRASDDRHTIEIADRAVAHLQLFDLLSLWLCCDCPLAGADRAKANEPFNLTSFTGELGPFRFTPLPTERSAVSGDNFWLNGCRQVAVEPWPFDIDMLPLNATGMLVPKLNSLQLWRQMVACSVPQTFGWEFVRV